jgi:gp16 family phage-associated protein
MHATTNQAEPLRSAGQVRHEFEIRGLSVAAWARTHVYSSALVNQVLSGRKRCLRGQSHEIAVRLGLKLGLAGSLDDVDAALTKTSPPPSPEGSIRGRMDGAAQMETKP